MYTRVETRLIRGEREERQSESEREKERERERDMKHRRGRGGVARAAVDHPEARCSLYPFYSRLLPSDLYDSDAPSGSRRFWGPSVDVGKASERERERELQRSTASVLSMASRCEFTHCAPRKHANDALVPSYVFVSPI